MPSKYESRYCFNKWKSAVENLGGEQFSSSIRKEELANLFHLFIANDISIHEAESYRNAATDTLTLENGRTKADYKKWFKKVSEDYDMILADTYMEFNAEVLKNDSPVIVSIYKIDNNKQIIDWVNNKFGKNVSNYILDSAHTIGNIYNLMFIKENY